jgi:8-oxo-dGTP pyrophosphatase MutT (NUDIX family)
MSTIRAAGVLLVSTEGRVLLLQRSDVSDLAGQWSIPGGKLEENEDTCSAAIRETLEECGFKVPKSRCEKWTQQIACHNGVDVVDFTTYIHRGVKEFTAKLCEEHIAFAWCDPASPPPGIHPGCLVSLCKLSPEWNELSVAKAIRDGQLTSPQEYENITFFDVRVTGTGEAYRGMKKDEKGNVLYEEEYVWRDPSLYLNPEFLERCNGLPVILEHPETSTLTTEEYRTRTIGALTLPYVKVEEVWAIARVQDSAAAKIMTEQQLSTSPAVSWNDPSGNVSGKMKDGTNFLIETKPSLLDHLAICWQGVWDKGGESQGVNIVRGDSMSDDIKATLEALLKNSTSLTTTVEGMNKGLTTLSTRLDSVEKRYDDDKKRRAQARVDSFKFSPRAKGETDKAYQLRLDAEEKNLCDAMDTAGVPVKEISDKARQFRRDAEEAMDAAAKADEFPPKKDSKKDEFPPKKDSAKADADEDEKKADEFPPKKDSKKDAAKADADEDEDDKEKKADEFPPKKDSKKDAKHDSRNDSFEDMKKELAMLKAGMKPLSDDDMLQVAKLSKRCDSIYVALGSPMPRLMPGENLIAYRHKLAADLKKHTKYKDVELSTIAADSVGFDLMVDDIFDKAAEFAKSPARLKPGELVQRTTRGDSGHVIHTYDGSSAAWMQQFAGPVQNHATKFLTQERK